MPKHKLTVRSLFSALWQGQCDQIVSSGNLIEGADEDVEMVHQYRIAIRKARSLLVFMKPLLKVAFFNQVNDQLKEFADHFAKVREWDVLIEYYRENYLKQLEENILLTDILMNEQRKYRINAYGSFDAQVIESTILTDVKDIETKGFKHKATEIQCIPFVKKRAKILRKAIGQKEKLLKSNELKRIHSYRIANKRLRYALELLNPVFEDAFDKRIKRLKAKTDHLGSRCDLYVMIEDLNALKTQDNEKMSALNDFIKFISNEMTKNDAKG